MSACVRLPHRLAPDSHRPEKTGSARPFELAAAVLVALSGGTLAQEEQQPAVPKIPPPDAAAAWVPDGFEVEVALSGLMYPSSVAFDDEGTLYVAECGYMPGDLTQPARIFRIDRSDPEQERREIVADGLSGPITDILWHDGKLFVSHKGKISVVAEGKVRDLVTGLPSFGDHSNNQLALGPDGKLYFGQGSATNSGVVGEDNHAFGWVAEHPEVCDRPARDITLRGQEFESKDPRATDGEALVETSPFQPFGRTVMDGTVVRGTTKANGAILRLDPDGSNLEVFAWGFRNPYGVQWGPDQELYVADAGSDVRGSRPIEGSLEVLWHVQKDLWYGWPDYFAGIPVTDERFHAKGKPKPDFVMKVHPRIEKPLMTFELHSSITQIAFSPNDAFGADRMFLASSGDQSAVTASEELRAGYWVKRVDVGTKNAEPFFHARPEALGPEGLEYVTTAGPKRLVDLAFSPDGDALYVVDIGPIHYVRGARGPQPMAFPGTGVVWRISR